MTDVELEVKRRLEPLSAALVADRGWLWICGVNLSGKENEATRATLKEIGFRYAPNGHPIPEFDCVGSWGHSCEHPIKRTFRMKPRREILDENPIANLASLGL